MSTATVEAALDAIHRGEMVVLVDDEERENEGDLCMAADRVSPEAINFMAKHGRGLICLTLTDERLRELALPMMVDNNSSQFETAFTVSIEAREGVTTGISAHDRAHTIRVAIAEDTEPRDLVRPGHIFPLRAKPGGVLVRTGQTEGSVDLARLAGLKPAGVICEILNDDGTMARMPDLLRFAEAHDLLVVSIADIIEYRLQRDRLVEKLIETPFPTEAHRDFRLTVYRSVVDGAEHLVLTLGDIAGSTEPTLVRVQHQCVVGDVFRGLDCGCGWQLHGALEAIAEAGRGVLVYLHKPELSRYDAVVQYVADHIAEDVEYAPPEEKIPDVNQVKPELRQFGIGAQILRESGVHRMRLLSNSQRKIVGLEAYGLELVDVVPIPRPGFMSDTPGGS